MSPWFLAWRMLQSRWRLGLLAAFCVAVSASVIVGALAVGDSVRGSLWKRLVTPLGLVRYAFASPTPMSPDRAEPGVAAALRLQGSASNQSELTMGGVTVWGIDRRFAALVPGAPSRIAEGEAWITPALARDLDLSIGDTAFLNAPKLTTASPEAVFAQRKPSDTTTEVAVTVAGVLPDSGAARFSLDPSFRLLRSAIVNRAWLARRLGSADVANVFMGASDSLASGLTAGDLGLRLVPAKSAGGWVLQGDSLVLTDAQVAAAQAAAKETRVGSARVSAALATTVENKGRKIAYAMAAWIEGVPPGINAWAAQDLGLRESGPIRADLLVSQPDGSYVNRSIQASAGAISRMEGIGAEPAFVPVVEGITDAQRMDRWQPPFPVDLHRITKRDEDYWDRYRAAPRLFLTREQLREAWGDSDAVTGVWIKGGDRALIESAIARFLAGSEEGAKSIPVRANAERAAQGSTDMAGLILALGAFVLAGALGLAATAFSLAVRQESRSYAILAATGVPRRSILRVAGVQGLLLAVAGSVLGILGGLGFAAGALAAMRALMPPDLGFDAMTLDARPVSFLIGAALAGLFAMASMALAVRSAGRGALVPVLRGGELPTGKGLANRFVWIWAIPAMGCLIASLSQERAARGLLFGAGLFFLAIGVTAFVLALRPNPGRRFGLMALLHRQSLGAAPSFLLGATLSGLATFALSAVAGQLRSADSNDPRLLVSTSVPVRIAFQTEEGRRRLGMSDEELSATRGMQVLSFLRSTGEDVSCLNPAKAVSPRFLGVSPDIARLRPFQTLPTDAWAELSQGAPNDRPAPALGDADTVAWTLESGIGKTIPLEGSRRAEFVGLIPNSPLAREILIPEADFKKAFPSVRSPSAFVVTPPPERERQTARAISRALAPLGPDIRTVREELGALHAVRFAYMAIFFALGLLGLALGVVAATFVALREAAAHRSRFALLRAVGAKEHLVTLLAVWPGLMSAALGICLGAGACLFGAPGSFAFAPVAAVVGSMIVVLALVNFAIARRWRNDNLVETLRSE